MSTNIFNIQRFSVHDGDGIRTTVFFSGCPLRCRWCHNPEGESFSPSLLYSSEKCIGCGGCAAVCKSSAVTFKDGKAVTDHKKCTACGACVPVCLADARSIAGRVKSIDDIVKICVSDRMFFEESGGGVTLSGGEIMAQDIGFVTSLMKKLNGEGISVNIDTSGYTTKEKLDAVLPYTDTFLYDIKSAIPEKHLYCTGVSLDVIYDNLKYLSAAGARIYIRLPVIAPDGADTAFDGTNYTDDDIDALIRLLSGINYSKIFLLPYHNTGIYKREALGYTEIEKFAVPSRERLEKIKQMLENAGFRPVSIGG